jgi:mono/diheme cytochrome c family protein
MSRNAWTAACLASLAAAALVAADRPATAAAPSSDAARIERGRYLVTVLGCNDCHTPTKMGENGPEPDMARMLSGHPEDLVMPPAPQLPPGPWQVVASGTTTAWAGPWGVSFTRNLTPDPETGLGSWTEQEFKDTLRSGRERGRGRQLLPPMPWQGYGQASDEDLGAVFAYLRSIPAVHNKVPEPIAPAAAPH